MAKRKEIKVKIDCGHLSPEEAEEELFKALDFQRSGDIHGDEFLDSVMEETAQKMISLHEKVWSETLKEIEDILDEEYE